MTDFVVVGGGVGGLVAARHLAKGGASVTLVEASDQLGGTVARHTVGGLVLDAGAESFANRGNTVADLAVQLGLGLDVVQPAPAPAWLQRGVEAFPLPATSLLGIPGIPLAKDVIDVVGTGTALRAYLEVLQPAGRGSRSETLGQLVRARMGAGMLEKLVAPITYGIHSKHPDELQLDRVAPGLRAALATRGSLARAVQSLRAQSTAGSAVSGIRGGLHRLVDELAVDLRTYGVEVRFNARYEPSDVPVVWAAPPTDVATRVTLVTLVLDAPELDAAPRGSGVLVAHGSPVEARALTHGTAKWQWLAERAGSGRHVLRLSYSSPPQRPADTALADASVLLGASLDPASVIDSAVVEWTRAAPRTQSEPGVTYVGEGTSGTGLANVIAQATSAAEELLTR